jgi:hypothetical protein
LVAKFFTLTKLLVVSVVIIIIIVGVVWLAYSNWFSPSNSSSPTPAIPINSPIQTATPKPSPTPSNSITPVQSATPHPTSISTATPMPTSAPTPTTAPTSSPTPQPPPSPTLSPTPTASPTPSPPITAVFNFDNATPTLTQGISTPIDQTSNTVTAHFSSPSDFPAHPAFSVQNLNSLAAISTVINSAKFSGLFLWPSTTNRDHLDISFSQNITSISFVFKTAELHDPGPGGTGSPIRLTAYVNSLSTPVGSPITVNGIETLFDNYTEGTLTFNSNGQPFNLVEIDLPYISAEGATGFIIDNITITTI